MATLSPRRQRLDRHRGLGMGSTGHHRRAMLIGLGRHFPAELADQRVDPVERTAEDECQPGARSH